MFTPYVELQRSLIDWLFELQKKRPQELAALGALCQLNDTSKLPWPQILRGMGFSFVDEEWHREYNLGTLVGEQIDSSGEQIQIRNLLGSPLYRKSQTNDFATWVKCRDSGMLLKSKKYAHVGALGPGDQLLSGEEILSLPREGGNGAVLLHLAGGRNERGVWLSYAGRTILPLIGCLDGEVPPELE